MKTTHTPLPGSLFSKAQKDICTWIVKTINNDLLTQNLTSSEVVLDLSDGKLLWEIVKTVDPSFVLATKEEPTTTATTTTTTTMESIFKRKSINMTQDQNPIKDFSLWCQKVLLLEREELSPLFSITIESQSSVLCLLLEISKRLYLFKAFELEPANLVLVELRLDDEAKLFTERDISSNDYPEIANGPQYDFLQNEQVYQLYESTCAGLTIKHIKAGLYLVEGFDFFHVEVVDQELQVRFRKTWISINDFFKNIFSILTKPLIPTKTQQNDEQKDSSQKSARKKTKHASLLEETYFSPRKAKLSVTLKMSAPQATGGFEKLLSSPIFTGQKVTIYGKNGAEPKFLRVAGNSLDSVYLMWSDSEVKQQADKLNTLFGRQCVKLSDGIEIRRGQRTSGFGKCDCTVQDDLRSFSFIYRKPGQVNVSSVDIVCATVEDQLTWVKDLRKTAVAVNKNAFSGRANILEAKWKEIAPSGQTNASLSKSQVHKLFRSLHIRVAAKELNALMLFYDTNGDRRWGYNEFERMIFDLETGARPEIRQIVHLHTGGKDYFTIFEFQRLLVSKQRENVGWRDLEKVIQKYEEPLRENEIHRAPVAKQNSGGKSFNFGMYFDITSIKKSGSQNISHFEEEEEGPKRPIFSISMLAFVRYLKSEENQLYDFNSKNECLDLSRPLNEYFIASSHNTYLVGAQYLAVSSVDAYIQAIRKGARCIELDLHEGTQECPIIITHGGAGTSLISFETVCRAIVEYAFESTKAPIILSLESHLHFESQGTCAAIFRKVFGDALLPAPADQGTSQKRLQSPRELYGKILLKGKGTVSSMSAFEEDEQLKAYITGKAELKNKPNSVPKFLTKKLSQTITISRSVSQRLVSNSRHDVSNKLSEIIFIKALKVKSDLKSLEAAKDKVHAWNMSSFPDTTVEGFVAADPSKFSSFNARGMSRVYPNPVHPRSWLSGNFSPVLSWCCGVQCAALNYQTFDIPMQLNDAFFSQNGGCGYVPKPTYLCDPDRPFNFMAPMNDDRIRPIRLRINIISGQNLEFPDNSHTKTMDPFVVVQVIGIPADRNVHVTPTVHDNGFNPIWNSSFEFNIYCPELALLHVQVIDKDETIEDTAIGYYCIAVNSMKEGYRHFPLKKIVDGKEISPFCTMFCFVEKVSMTANSM